MIDVDLSENINGRTAKMSLIYDESHQVELVVEQGKAPTVLVESTLDLLTQLSSYLERQLFLRHHRQQQKILQTTIISLIIYYLYSSYS